MTGLTSDYKNLGRRKKKKNMKTFSGGPYLREAHTE